MMHYNIKSAKLTKSLLIICILFPAQLWSFSAITVKESINNQASNHCKKSSEKHSKCCCVDCKSCWHLAGCCSTATLYTLSYSVIYATATISFLNSGYLACKFKNPVSRKLFRPPIQE